VIEDGRFLSTEYKAISDAVWIAGLLEQGYRCGVLNRPLATFVQTGDNMGQQPAGRAEHEAWQRQDGWWRRLRSGLWRVAHRIRKLFDGSYRIREVSVDVYGDDSDRRVHKTARVSGRWRRNAEDA
jgi:hypothetical protein